MFQGIHPGEAELLQAVKIVKTTGQPPLCFSGFRLPAIVFITIAITIPGGRQAIAWQGQQEPETVRTGENSSPPDVALELASADKAVFDIPDWPFAFDEQLACGPRCVQFLFSLFDRPVDYETIIRECATGPRGTTLLQLQSVLENHGVHVVPLGNVTVGKLKRLPCPAIVHLSTGEQIGHFLVVVCWKPDQKRFRVYSPPNRYDEVAASDLSSLISGVALAVSDEPLPPADQIIEPGESLFFPILATVFSLTCLVLCLIGLHPGRTNSPDPAGEAPSDSGNPARLPPPVTGILVFATLLLSGCQGPVSSGKAEDPRNVNVGEYVAGPMLEYSFRIPNEGVQPFHVVEIKRTCGCHSVEFDPEKPVPPGENAEVTVKLPTAGNEGPTRYQFVMETDSTEAGLRHIPLFLTVDLKCKIKAFPSRVTFGKLQAGVSETSRITITSREVNPREILLSSAVVQERPCVTLIPAETDSPDIVSFEVQVAEDAPLGDLTGFIVLKFDDRQVPEISIPVIGRIEGAIRTTPGVLVRNVGERSRPVVRVSSKNDTVFAIRDIRSDPAIRLEPATGAGDGKQFRYRLEFSEDISPGNYSIVFETDHPVQKTITLPVIIH